MNKILVSGLAIGADPNIQTCNVCNYDLSWLFNYPSTLLWADKIILTPNIFDTIKDSSYHPDGNDDMGKAISLIFEGLEKHGLIEIKTPSDIITDGVVDEIYKQIDLDKAELELRFPKAIKDIEDKGVPGQFCVDGTEYCGPALWTNYASLILAKEWKANLLFSEHSKIYFN